MNPNHQNLTLVYEVSQGILKIKKKKVGQSN